MFKWKQQSLNATTLILWIQNYLFWTNLQQVCFQFPGNNRHLLWLILFPLEKQAWIFFKWNLICYSFHCLFFKWNCSIYYSFWSVSTMGNKGWFQFFVLGYLKRVDLSETSSFCFPVNYLNYKFIKFIFPSYLVLL